MAGISTVLFGKYQICGILGTGRAGTVFLAVHLELEEYRAIKRVAKSFLNYDHFRKEALILKELRHPGIPIIYDVEEDESYSYLIEEYLEGESLFDLVKRKGHLSKELTIFYGIQLTNIIHYLHSAGPDPILHLDLQPKNLLLCHDTIKLIDFGLAASLEDANVPGERYGTVGCAAPEQYKKDQVLDERTDLYAIGAILHYLYSGRFPGQSHTGGSLRDTDLSGIINRCIKEEKEERFLSAQELGERLLQLKNMGTAAKDCLQSSSLTIALFGSKSGAGTTHIGVGLSVYLKNQGFPNVFEEKNDSGMEKNLLGPGTGKRDQYGLLRFGDLVFKPYYGPGVKLKKSPVSIKIQDYGKQSDQVFLEEPDVMILVCDISPWSWREAEQVACEIVQKGVPYAIVYNHTIRGTRISLPKGVVVSRCFRAPHYPNPFSADREVKAFYRALSSKILEERSHNETRFSKIKNQVKTLGSAVRWNWAKLKKRTGKHD